MTDILHTVGSNSFELFVKQQGATNIIYLDTAGKVKSFYKIIYDYFEVSVGRTILTLKLNGNGEKKLDLSEPSGVTTFVKLWQDVLNSYKTRFNRVTNLPATVQIKNTNDDVLLILEINWETCEVIPLLAEA